MAKQRRGSIPLSPPSQSASVSEPNNQSPPTVDYYEKIAERAYKEIEWVGNRYKLAAIILGAILGFGMAIIGILTWKTINEHRDFLSQRTNYIVKFIVDNANQTKEIIQRDVALHKDNLLSDLTKSLNKQIAEQFSDPRIKDTLTKVAETQAHKILEEEVRPSAQSFENSLQEIRAKWDQEVSYLKQRNHLTLLGDRAISDANRKALDELREVARKSNEQSLRVAAIAEIIRVESFWSQLPENVPTGVPVQLVKT
jgi:hypothetical protein